MFDFLKEFYKEDFKVFKDYWQISFDEEYLGQRTNKYSPSANRATKAFPDDFKNFLNKWAHDAFRYA